MMIILLALLAAATQLSLAFVVPHCHDSVASPSALFMSTVVTPPDTDTDTERRQKRAPSWIPAGEGEGDLRGPVEWLIDDSEVSREIDDPFHILLLDATFLDAPRITIQYVASSCAYVLGMPFDESAELAAHAKAEGFSCLGTWGHEECLRLATQLQQRDLVCRVVPFCEGGDRAWQARNAEEGAGMKRAEEDAR